MKTVYTHTYASLAVFLLVFAASTFAIPAYAQPVEMQDLHIRITSNGIVQQPTSPELQGGLYRVTVTNETQGRRGLVMKGIDKAVSPYIRFTKVLAPGQQVTFRWFFPTDRQVMVRDLTRCYHVERTCKIAGVGGMTSTLIFG